MWAAIWRWVATRHSYGPPTAWRSLFSAVSPGTRGGVIERARSRSKSCNVSSVRTMTRKQQRLGLLALGMAALGGATALVLVAFNDNLVFFYSPSELKAKAVAADRRVRIGGLVEKESLARGADGRQVSFRVTDGATVLAVVYQGLLPDLFREGQGVVVEG